MSVHSGKELKPANGEKNILNNCSMNVSLESNKDNIENEAKNNTFLFKVPILPDLPKKPTPKTTADYAPSNLCSRNNNLNQNGYTQEEVEMEDYNGDEPQDYFGYRIPNWSRMPSAHRFVIEEVKGQTCVFTKSFKKEFYLIGRNDNCHVVSRHQSISRYHAVIQYGNPLGDEKNPGFYLFDMDTTHGSFINNQRIKSSTFVKLNVDTDKFHFGCSTRRYAIRTTKNLLMIERRKKIEGKTEDEKSVEPWVDWGMGEDADEGIDLSHNPYASDLNEELYLTNPKKILKEWFEKEGKELSYDLEKKRSGEYCCRVAIPVDDLGVTLQAEATMKGKKKQAITQAALEACRVLDKRGLLRQSFSSKRKRARDCEENDFYDSEDDTFFDRTGEIEKKRMKKIQHHGKVETKVHTYNSLLKDHEILLKKIGEYSKYIEKSRLELNCHRKTKDDRLDEDLVASQMDIAILESGIKQATKDLEEAKTSENKLIGLINLAKPANQPKLQSQFDCEKLAFGEIQHESTK